MDWWQAMLLGIVEGVTEYLPVSSTGHLILTQRLLDIPADQAAGAYAICIQAGAILAVLGLYRGQVKRMLNGLLGRDRAGLALAGNIVVAFLPAAVAGVLLGSLIEEHLFGLWPIIGAWLVGGLAILLVSGRQRMPRQGEEVTDSALVDDKCRVRGCRVEYGGCLVPLHYHVSGSINKRRRVEIERIHENDYLVVLLRAIVVAQSLPHHHSRTGRFHRYSGFRGRGQIVTGLDFSVF